MFRRFQPTEICVTWLIETIWTNGWFSPLVENIHLTSIMCLKNSNEVRENCLPDSQFELMKEVHHKHKKEVESQCEEPLRECVL